MRRNSIIPNSLVYQDANGETQPVKSAKDWAKRREQILAGMQQAMGPLPDRSHLPPFDLKVLARETGNGFERQTISISRRGQTTASRRICICRCREKQTTAGPRCWPCIPPGRRGRASSPAKARGPTANTGLELAKRGYVVICPDYPSFGDSASYDFNADNYQSGTMKGIFNHMRCVDYLISREEVDPDRIGVIGHSLGGHNSLFVAAFDPRIKVIVSSCGWTPFHDYYGGKIAGWTSDRYMPLLKTKYDLDPRQGPLRFLRSRGRDGPPAVLFQFAAARFQLRREGREEGRTQSPPGL